ncbi:MULTISPECIES: BMP family lipoprotein [Paenibacillus]|uniref:BMP family lipoprotein n=1 Tax=Paenibacillus TaxID=44249 RepID=UPI0007E47B4C|nr:MULTISPECIES: BMP family protein [Paenibacillus]MCZ1263760.1 BMP family ABC transporter substrate-binding protein [Paenibacillus tundrae]OAX45388.1 Membrane lipoprotein TmpC [Paenibacillus sp. AD87]WDQ34056.1 BMP family protein [Paenibacillus marchantiae]SDL72571.1 basic membrane protein A [Paenibacillus sp. OK060]SLK08472.1 basic membrane protein A [Paenibacillus sp. RU5A]
MKRGLSFVLSIIMLAILLAACGNSASKDEQSAQGGDSEKSLRMALVLPEKIGVNPFFVQMDEGFKKAGEEFKVDTKTIESTDPAAFEQNLRAAVAENYDLIITATFQAEDALKKVAAENPDKSFAVVDTTVDLPNVRSVGFHEYEGAYLLGAAAGLSTKTDKVGMIAAMDVPLIKKYTEGFKAGLESVNPKAEFLVNYVGGFNDPAKAKELALVQFGKGADFIAAASAVGDLGVFEAAKEKGFYTSGQDTDRTVEDPEHIVLSQLKSTDTVSYQTVKDFVEGNFKAGAVNYGLKEDGVGLTYVTRDSETPLNAFVGQEVIDKVKAIKDDIVSGKIVVKDPLQQ